MTGTPKIVDEGGSIPAAFRPPPGAWDCHCHVIGPQALFPFAPERTYTPDDAPADQVMSLHRALGLEHAVLVQPAAHGADHAALLDALGRSAGRYRGVMLVDDDAADLPVFDLQRRGIRGVRYNLMPHLGAMPDLAKVRAVASFVGPAGWHICLHLTSADLHRVDDWLDLGLPLVIDHMARLDLASGTAERDLQRLIEALSHPRLFIKLSAADRLSQEGPPYRDGVAIARRLFEAAPQKCLWGTDFPHPNHPSVPDDHTLMDLVHLIAPTAADQHLLLVDNPLKLYR